jgi:hypothetical protein
MAGCRRRDSNTRERKGMLNPETLDSTSLSFSQIWQVPCSGPPALFRLLAASSLRSLLSCVVDTLPKIAPSTSMSNCQAFIQRKNESSVPPEKLAGGGGCNITLSFNIRKEKLMEKITHQNPPSGARFPTFGIRAGWEPGSLERKSLHRLQGDPERRTSWCCTDRLPGADPATGQAKGQ